ncbi:TPA: hypothetical protein ACNABL_004783 [Escherichia coli]
MSWKLGTPGFERDIPKPDEFDIDHFEIASEDRTASGRKVKEITAKKKIFKLAYKGLPASDITVLREEYDKDTPLSFFYEDEGQTKNAIVWFSRFSRKRLETKNEYWQVEIELEEQ